MRERGRRRKKSRKEISYIDRRKFVEELYYIDYLLTMFDLHGLAQGLFKLLLNHSIYRKKLLLCMHVLLAQANVQPSQIEFCGCHSLGEKQLYFSQGYYSCHVFCNIFGIQNSVVFVFFFSLNRVFIAKYMWTFFVLIYLWS